MGGDTDARKEDDELKVVDIATAIGLELVFEELDECGASLRCDFKGSISARNTSNSGSLELEHPTDAIVIANK